MYTWALADDDDWAACWPLDDAVSFWLLRRDDCFGSGTVVLAADVPAAAVEVCADEVREYLEG